MTVEKPSKATTTIRSPDALLEHGLIAEDGRTEIDRVAQQFAIAITPSVFETIAKADPDLGVARQYVPSVAENTITPSELHDPIGDLAHSPINGIIHRYRDRVLLNVVKNCAVYCRFCFRREQVGPHSKALKPQELQNALNYIRDHKEIWEVIMSGGDPLMLPAKQLTAISGTLAEMEHVRVMRIHTRVPAAAPDRITDDLIRALRVMTPTYVVIHINHPDELTDAVKATFARMVDAGIPLLSQTVLLRHINDQADTLERLFRRLVEARVKPYYLHVADQAKGTSHFRTGIEAGQKIAQDLRGDISGLCQPTLVLDIPGGHGKVPVGPCFAEQTSEGFVVSDIKGKFHDYPAD